VAEASKAALRLKNVSFRGMAVLRVHRAPLMSGDYRVLLAIDLSSGTSRLLDEAQRFGQALNAIVDIIHVAEPDPDFVGYLKRPVADSRSQEDMIRSSHAEALSIEHQQAQAFAATLRTNGVRVDQTLTVQGPTLETILSHARKFGTDLIVLGSHRRSTFHRLWYGNTVGTVTEHAPCAVLVIPVES